MPTLLTLAMPAGLLIGLSLGALGGGGSILTVPALVYLLGQSPHSATTGSLIVVGITALAGLLGHARAGRVRLRQGLVFGTLGIAGSYVGSRLAAAVDPHLLLVAFSGLMLVAAAAMWRRRRPASPSPGNDLTDPPRRRVAANQGSQGRPEPGKPTTRGPAGAADGSRSIEPLRVVLAATAVGLLTGFFGVGGGFVVVPALVLALHFDLPTAVGTSLLVIAIDSAAALLARLAGSVPVGNWPLLLAFTAAAVAGTAVGSRLTGRVRPARLTAGFVLLLLAVAGYTAIRSLPHVVA